jgi:hypothetical protein
MQWPSAANSSLVALSTSKRESYAKLTVVVFGRAADGSSVRKCDDFASFTRQEDFSGNVVGSLPNANLLGAPGRAPHNGTVVALWKSRQTLRRLNASDHTIDTLLPGPSCQAVSGLFSPGQLLQINSHFSGWKISPSSCCACVDSARIRVGRTVGACAIARGDGCGCARNTPLKVGPCVTRSHHFGESLLPTFVNSGPNSKPAVDAANSADCVFSAVNPRLRALVAWRDGSHE